MALTWPQFDHNYVILHYFFIVLATLFSENFNHFRNLKANILHKWSEHCHNMGQIWPLYPLNIHTLLVLTSSKYMLSQQKNQPIQTPRREDIVEIDKTWS